MDNNTNTVLGVLTGTAIGAVIGILMAPDKGVNTRRKISENVMETKDHLAESAMGTKNRVMDKLTSNKHSLESQLNQIVTDTRYRSEDVISRLEAKLKDLKASNKKVRKQA